MFKEFFDLFRKESLLKQAYNRSLEMIREDREMFVEAMRSLREHDDAKIGIDIYAKDQMINAYEREVRRHVLTHLTVAQGQNAHAGLALVSVVVDIERIGDYTKNIYDLAVHHPTRLDAGEFESQLDRIETVALENFRRTAKAFKSGDVDEARSLMHDYKEDISARVREVEAKLVEGSTTLPVADAVSLALYLRFLKRISAHSRNLVSSLVNPLDRIGYEE